MSKLWAPTLSLSRVRKELPALMAIQTVLSEWYAAHYHNRNRIQVRCGYTCRAVDIALISTYELGRQTFGLASPVAWLRKRGHHVVSLDLSRQSLDESAVREAKLIAIYLPMHTATRLAAQLIPSLRQLNPSAHLGCPAVFRSPGPFGYAGHRKIRASDHSGRRLSHRRFDRSQPRLQTSLPALSDRAGVQGCFSNRRPGSRSRRHSPPGSCRRAAYHFW